MTNTSKQKTDEEIIYGLSGRPGGSSEIAWGKKRGENTKFLLGKAPSKKRFAQE